MTTMIQIIALLLAVVRCTQSRNIAIIESSTHPPQPSVTCNRKLSQYKQSSNRQILFSWYENPQETTAWSQSKDCDTIYIRSLKDSHEPLPRKSQFSWWPLSYSWRKGDYQEQEFNIYYTGRTFYGIDNSKISLSDVRELDKQILSHIFADSVSNITRAGIINNCSAKWEPARRTSGYHAQTHIDTSLLAASTLDTSTFSAGTMRGRRVKTSYISSVGFDDNAAPSNCTIGVLDMPVKRRLSDAFRSDYESQHVVHIGWDQWRYQGSYVCECKNLYIRITQTSGQMPGQLLVQASDIVFSFAAWYPTTRKRRIYIKVELTPGARRGAIAPRDAFTDRVIQETLNKSDVIPAVTTETPTKMPTVAPTTRVLEAIPAPQQMVIHQTDRKRVSYGSIIGIFVLINILLCTAVYFVKKKFYDTDTIRGVSLMVTRHPIVEHDVENVQNNTHDTSIAAPQFYFR